MPKDLLQRFIFENEPVRGEYVKLTECLQSILNEHQYPESVRKLLGESLCAAVLLSAIIKFKGRLTLQFKGKGKLRLLLAQCDDQYHMRGLAKYDGEMTYDELMASFKEGILMILLDSGVQGQRYQGIVEWQGSSLAESIEGYFKNSEQLPTKIWLCATEKNAAGFFLQVIPAAGGEARELENEITAPGWYRITQLTEAADMSVLQDTQYPDFLSQIFPQETIRVFDPSSVTFKCTCTRKRGEDAISLLGREEAEEELRDKQVIVVTCEFCNKEYEFDRVDVETIFKKRENPSSDSQVH